MISAVFSGSSFYTPVQPAGKTTLPHVEAVLAAENSKQIARETAATKAAYDERQKYLQTNYIGPARAAARLSASGNERPASLQALYVGPPHIAARVIALQAEATSASTLNAYHRDLRSGCLAGPKPISELAADERYRLARVILG